MWFKSPLNLDSGWAADPRCQVPQFPTLPRQPLLQPQSHSPGCAPTASLSDNFANHFLQIICKSSAILKAVAGGQVPPLRPEAGSGLGRSQNCCWAWPRAPQQTLACTGQAEAETEGHKETLTVPIFAASIFRLKSQFRGSLRDILDQEGLFLF